MIHKLLHHSGHWHLALQQLQCLILQHQCHAVGVLHTTGNQWLHDVRGMQPCNRPQIEVASTQRAGKLIGSLAVSSHVCAKLLSGLQQHTYPQFANQLANMQ